MAEQQDVAALEAQIAELRAENDELRSGQGPDTQMSQRTVAQHHRLRWTGAVALLVVAALLTAPALVGFWGRRTIVDTQRYLDTVAPLSRSTVVQQAVSEEVTNELLGIVDVQGFIATNLPEQAQALGPALTGAVQNFVQSTVEKFLASDRFDQLWLDVNRTVQQQLVAALNGDQSGSVQIRDGTVYLDLAVVAQAVQQALVERGLTIFGRVTIPATTGHEIVLLSSDQLKTVQNIWTFANPIARWMLPVVALLYVGAVLLAPNRRRMLITAGVVIAAAMALLALALNITRGAYVSATASRPHGTALTVFYDTMIRYLWGAVGAALLLGVLIAFFAWLAGPSAPAQGIRDLEGRATGAVGAGIARWHPMVGVGTAFARWRVELRNAAVAMGVLVFLMIGHATWQNVAWTVFWVLVAWLVIDAVAAAGRAGDTAGEPAPGEPVSA